MSPANVHRDDYGGRIYSNRSIANQKELNELI